MGPPTSLSRVFPTYLDQFCVLSDVSITPKVHRGPVAVKKWYLSEDTGALSMEAIPVYPRLGDDHLNKFNYQIENVNNGIVLAEVKSSTRSPFRTRKAFLTSENLITDKCNEFGDFFSNKMQPLKCQCLCQKGNYHLQS